MKLIYRERNRGVEIPWFYGVAWEEDFGHCRVYGVLGLNVVMRWLRLLRWYVGRYPKHELYTLTEIIKLGEDSYADGVAAGLRIAMQTQASDTNKSS